jgi:hypothetical protein
MKTYLITMEVNESCCAPRKRTGTYTLNYSLSSKENINKFIKATKKKNHYTHLAILFICRLESL